MKKIIIILMVLMAFFTACKKAIDIDNVVDNTPIIFPDYKQVTIPPNIAPLNFRVEESGVEVIVRLSGKSNNEIVIKGHNCVQIPNKKWHKLIEESAGDSITIVVSIKRNNEWTQFAPFAIYISSYSIDKNLVYRRIAPGYEMYSHMGIFQRNLYDFDEKPIIENTLYHGSCVNCHSLCQNNPEIMMFHLRGQSGGTILMKDGELVKLNGKTKETIGNFQYPYWHPSGKYIAYSVNKTKQDFHSYDKNRIEVYDEKSDVIVYDIEKNTILTTEAIFSEERFETWPLFSPNGDYLYYTSAQAVSMPYEFEKVKYSLCRIHFDAHNGHFGDSVDTLINALTTNQSVAFPRISPDGRFLIVTRFDYGNFSIWHKEADLYMIDLQTGEERFMDELNSNDVESYHSWSSNGKWLVFSSRRINGLYTMPYISFIDEEGRAGKPFLLPQKNPDYYDLTLYSFNIPEFATAPIDLNIRLLEKTVSGNGEDVTFQNRN